MPRWKMNSLAVALLVALPWSSAGAEQGAHPNGVRAEFGQDSLPLGSWFALRFNLTPGSDLRIDGDWWGCDSKDEPDSTLGYGIFVIADGKLRIDDMTLQSYGWGAGSEVARVSVGDYDARSPSLGLGHHCAGAPIFTGVRGTPASHSFTVVVISLAPRSSWNATATWTRNVTGYDFVTGDGTALTKGDFRNGAHANIHPLPRVSAGAFLQHSIETSNDVIGWFWPDPFGNGVGEYSCTRNREHCDPLDGSLYLLESTERTEWEFRIERELRQQEAPYRAMGIIELPDDSYLG